MNVATMTMPKHEAKAKLRAYQRNIERVTNTEHRAEYEQIAAGLKHLERGRKLIDLAQVFLECPHDEHGRPKLAVCRADQRQVRVEGQSFAWREHNVQTFRQVSFSGDTVGLMRRRNQAESLTRVFTLAEPRPMKMGWALVPCIPIEHRPTRFDAKAHHILWEVEEWADTRIRARPDIDPYLLRHIGGTLYSIIAEWDLTPLERAIVAGRAAV